MISVPLVPVARVEFIFNNSMDRDTAADFLKSYAIYRTGTDLIITSADRAGDFVIALFNQGYSRPFAVRPLP